VDAKHREGMEEELFHLHYWSHLEKKGHNILKLCSDDGQWRLSEAVASLVISELRGNPSLYWDEEVNRLSKRLENDWRNRKSYDAFMEKSLKLVKN
jgi:hypothetical protein